MDQDTISLISRIRENANKFICKELETSGITGIVPSHGDIMAVLFKSHKCTMKELAANIRRTKATLTVLVDKLEKIGYVKREKSSQDSRVTYITLTKKGLDLKPVFEDISKKLNNLVFTDISEKEGETLHKILEKIEFFALT